MQTTVQMQGFDEVVFGNPIGCDRKDSLWAKLGGRWYKISANRTPVPENFPVTPAMIVYLDFAGVFGRLEAEQFATKLVRVAQRNGGWKSFAEADLGGDYFDDNNLRFFTELGFVVKDEHTGQFRYTQGFVNEVLSAQ